MPIPDAMLNKRIIPRIFTPATTVEEVLYLFKEQPSPSQYVAVVRTSSNEYDVLTLYDLYWAGGKVSDPQELLQIDLGAVPGLLQPTEPLRQDEVDEVDADLIVRDYPRQNAVVVDKNGAVVGFVLFQRGSSDTGYPENTSILGPLSWIEPPPAVLGEEESAERELPPVRAYLNTRFDGVAPNQSLTVGSSVTLRVSVGAPTVNNLSQSTRPFAFDFAGVSGPVNFTVDVAADPEAWEVIPVKPTLIVIPLGTTQQDAMFLITPRKPCSDKLVIRVERADTGVTVQTVWLPVVAEIESRPLATLAMPRIAVTRPLATTEGTRRTVEITVQNDEQSFRMLMRADLPNGTRRANYKVPIAPAAVQNFTSAIRKALLDIINYRTAFGSFSFANLAQLTADEADARKAVVPLAEAGWQTWDALFNPLRSSDKEELNQLADDLRSLPDGSSIQILLDSQEFILPWNLLYDKPGPITPETLDWSGFWGYRYAIDMLPLSDYPTVGLTDTPLGIQALFNDDPSLRAFTSPQEELLRSQLAGVQANIAWGAAAIKQALSQPNSAALIYFYCHGVHESGAVSPTALVGESALTFGPNERMRLIDLRNLPTARLDHRPLVFLNACESATQDVFFYDGFMPFFIERQGARGFIGTEIKTPQLLAKEFAVEFFQAFMQGQPVGQILWQLRRKFLDTHHTILGFNYSLYGDGDVHLVQPAPPTS